MNGYRNTPSLSAIDPRALRVRSVAYCCADSTLPAEVRINRTGYDAAGRVAAQWDPRLWALRASDVSSPANCEGFSSLSGAQLGSRSVDAGERVSLMAADGQPLHSWDGRGSQQQIEYDDLLRPVAMFEQPLSGLRSCVERYRYGIAGKSFTDRNQYGHLIRHDDPAGSLLFNEFGLNGRAREQTRHFLQTLSTPDWPLEGRDCDGLLEGRQGATTLFDFNAVGEVVQQIDVQGNRQNFLQTCNGQLLETQLHLKNVSLPHVLVRSIYYNAAGQIQQQTAGNGVVSRFEYCPHSGRLLRMNARLAQQIPLQDLNYAYDPVGNILSIEDKALPIRYFSNQRVEPINRYGYDSLYQLVTATGWEAGSANKGPEGHEDAQAVANYHQTYRYDAGGNLLELIHQGLQAHGRLITAAKYSNRCLPQQGGIPPTEAEIAAGFDLSGNLSVLDRGRTLSWDTRNQLREVRPVERESGADDYERYIYDANNMRQRKIRSTQTNARTLISETRYFPGLEMRPSGASGETLCRISAQAGRNSVQVFHWENTLPANLINNQFRYTLGDHQGSCSLELDSDARVVSREIYHPYGSTALWERGDSSEASYRTLSYSGKEQDATGLYYYGLRYYMSWLQRWVNPEPAGAVDGLNLYSMVVNNPIRFVDSSGFNKDEPGDVFTLEELQTAGAARTEALLKAPQDNTPDNSLNAASKKKFMADRKKHPDGAVSKNLLSSLVAHSFAYYEGGEDSKRMYMNYFNIPGPSSGPWNYSGAGGVIEHHLAGDHTDETLQLGVYKIDDPQLYLDNLEKNYASALQCPIHQRVFTVAEMEENPILSRTVTQSHLLTSTVRNWTGEHIANSSNYIPVRAGGPGAHAEVRLVNSIIALYPNDAENRLNNLTLSTHRLVTKDPVRDFEACYNCQGILPEQINIPTGRSSMSYAEFNARFK